MKLAELTPQMIMDGPVPMDNLLKDSVYYPACLNDGRPITLCNTAWRRLSVNSYVYCDFGMGVDEFLADIGTMYGYHLLAQRLLDPSEYIPEGWQGEFIPPRTKFGGGGYWDTLGVRKQPHGACWAVLERDHDISPIHGPERLSILYVCGEGLATFQQLYCSRGLAPKMICFIQCWGFACNWTDFSAPGAPFHRTILKHPECTPEWLCLGYHNNVVGAVRLKNLDYAGVTLVRYVSNRALHARFGDTPAVLSSDDEGHVLLLSKQGRNYLAVRLIHHMGYLMYDVTDSRLDMQALTRWLILRDPGRGGSAESKLHGWAGLEGFAKDGPVLDEKLNWRGLDRNPQVAKAIAVVRSAVEIYGRSGVTAYSPLMKRSMLWARDVLAENTYMTMENGLPSFQRGLSLEACRNWLEALPSMTPHVFTNTGFGRAPEAGRFRVPDMYDAFVR